MMHAGCKPCRHSCPALAPLCRPPTLPTGRRLPLPSRLPASVSRIKARSDLYEMDLTLDVNTDVYPGALQGGLLLLLGTSNDGSPRHSRCFRHSRCLSRRPPVLLVCPTLLQWRWARSWSSAWPTP